MQKLAFGALFVGLLVACGGGNDNKKITIPDASDDSGGAACNVLTQTGCNAGEKCSWIHDATTPTPLGHIGCAPDGTIAAGAACMYGPDGAMGYDNCTKGNVCVSGKCGQICDQNGGAPTCAMGYACGLYSSLFDVGGMTAAGVCDKTCDPLADNDFDGSGPDVKTGTACAASQGCYGFPGTVNPTHATCTGEFNKTLVQRSLCNMAGGCAPDSTHVYLNGCAQGYIPLLDEMTGSSNAVCISFCKPADCWLGTGNCPTNNLRGTSPHDCTNTHNQGTYTTSTAGGTNGDQCFYSWAFEYDTMGNHIPSPTSDTLGYCIDHSKYNYDSNGNGMADAGDMAWPRCDVLGIGSNFVPPGASGSAAGHDATYFGCVSTATATANNNPPFKAGQKRALMDVPRFPYQTLSRQ